MIFDLSLQDIDEVKNLEKEPGLILTKNRSAILGKVTKSAQSGQPAGLKNKIIINVMDEQKWLKYLQS